MVLPFFFPQILTNFEREILLERKLPISLTMTMILVREQTSAGTSSLTAVTLIGSG